MEQDSDARRLTALVLLESCSAVVAAVVAAVEFRVVRTRAAIGLCFHIAAASADIQEAIEQVVRHHIRHHIEGSARTEARHRIGSEQHKPGTLAVAQDRSDRQSLAFLDTDFEEGSSVDSLAGRTLELDTDTADSRPTANQTIDYRKSAFHFH